MDSTFKRQERDDHVVWTDLVNLPCCDFIRRLEEQKQRELEAELMEEDNRQQGIPRPIRTPEISHIDFQAALHRLKEFKCLQLSEEQSLICSGSTYPHLFWETIKYVK